MREFETHPEVQQKPPDEQRAYLQGKFVELLSLNLVEINELYLEGKKFLREGLVTQAFDEAIMLAFISLKRLDLDRTMPESDRTYVRQIVAQTKVKVLKLLYVCLALLPDLVERLKNFCANNEGSRLSSNARALSPKIDQKTLMKHIAMDIYMEDIFNLGKKDADSEILPGFSQFSGALELEVYSYEYDNERARRAKVTEEHPTPTPEQ